MPMQPADLTPAQIRAAIPKLERRLGELNTTATGTDGHLNERTYKNILADHSRRIEETLISVFGHDTLDYHRYAIGPLDPTPITMGVPTPFQERLKYIKQGIDSAINTLTLAISILKERLQESGETPEARALNAYRGLDLHPEIARAASQLYQNEHYANAVEDAVKALNGLVRLRSGLDIDGSSLMQKAFSPKDPILKFNALSDQSDRDEQTGFMMMFSGAVSGLRNPRAHRFIRDEPERALEFIAFVSLLAKLLDGAKK
jgi:uncharacterized protein (TIGR02391 family)